MIEVGGLTVIDFVTYTCIRIENGVAHLKDVVGGRGRPKTMNVEHVPYFKDGEFIVPEIPTHTIARVPTKLNIRKLLKEETEMQFTNDACRFLSEWAETAVANMIAWAVKNAEIKEHTKLTAAHFYWWELSTNQDPTGFWENQIGYASRDSDE